MTRIVHFFATSAAVLLLTACATTGRSGNSTTSASAAGVPVPTGIIELPPQAVRLAALEMPALERDRAAIRAMAGEYRVRFAFDETVPLEPGYALRDPQRSGATEWVFIIEDTPQRISLQHILVMGDAHHVVKHWRQDWEYEPTHMLVFRGHRRWDNVALAPEERRGRWLQSVWEVDDSPRYFGLGRWEHRTGESAWTSAPSYRPLPRREYTKRDDYHLLRVVNRHLLTPTGWVHEQDNTKLVLVDGRERPLVKEFGLNTYTRIAGYDFAAGRDYWTRTAPFWAQVRKAWEERIAAGEPLQLRAEVEDQPLYEHMFALAEAVAEGETIDRQRIDRVLDRFSLTDDARAITATVEPSSASQGSRQ